LNSYNGFGHVEEAAIGQGRQLKDMSLEEMDALWNEAKSKYVPNSIKEAKCPKRYFLWTCYINVV